MKIETWLVSALLGLLACQLAGNALADGSQIYQAHCRGCHGPQLQGASATALIKTDWKFGRGTFSLDSNIRNGIVGTDMPAYREILSDEEISSVIVFIYESQTSAPGVPDPLPPIIRTDKYDLGVDVIVSEGVAAPWGIEFVDERTALITDNSGVLYWLVDDQLDSKPITGLPPVDVATSTGGLMDIALDPDYKSNGWVYLAISHSEDPNDRYAPGMTQVIRGRIRDYQWTDTEYLFRLGDEYHLGDSKHWGGRMLFDSDGKLFFSIGDMSKPEYSQHLDKPSGKVFRIRADGSVSPDNPFVDNADALPQVFSIGKRNVQGIAEHPATGAIWASEHGPRGGDELNVINGGKNYGWPLVTYGINYDGSPISENTKAPGIEDPVVQWTPGIAISAIEFVTGPLFPQWENDLLVGSLAFEELRRLEIRNDQVLSQEILFKGYGRIRDIKVSPGGAIYLLLNLPGQVVKIVPPPDQQSTDEGCE